MQAKRMQTIAQLQQVGYRGGAESIKSNSIFEIDESPSEYGKNYQGKVNRDGKIDLQRVSTE